MEPYTSNKGEVGCILNSYGCESSASQYSRFIPGGTSSCVHWLRDMIPGPNGQKTLFQLVIVYIRNFPAFYGTRRFITVSKRAFHWSLFWAKSIQSIQSHPFSLRSILILSTHLRLGLPSGLFLFGFPTNILSYMHSSSPPLVLIIYIRKKINVKTLCASFPIWGSMHNDKANGIEINSKGFWRCSITLRITVFWALSIFR
jgi:hypothetical protein